MKQGDIQNGQNVWISHSGKAIKAIVDIGPNFHANCSPHVKCFVPVMWFDAETGDTFWDSRYAEEIYLTYEEAEASIDLER